MKNFYSLLIFCCFFLSCTDDNEAARTDNSTTLLASKPEAKSMFDNSYKGIYKGIVIGNVSGTLHINILNDESIWAKFQTEDKVTYTLESIPYLEDGGIISSVPTLKKYRFGDENISFEVKLDEAGNNIETSNFKYFSDTSSKICLVKEKSTSLIKCYTGDYIGLEESGTVNFTSDGYSRVRGLAKNSNSPEVFTLIGEIEIIFPNGGISKTGNSNNPIIQYQLNANLHVGYIRGYLDGYRFDGNWMTESIEIGNWGATRIL